MKFLITGGNFNNKGAQAMVYITCSELRKRYPDAEIVVCDLCYDGKEKSGDYKFVRIQDCLSVRVMLGGNIIEQSFAKILCLLKKQYSQTKLIYKDMESAINGADGIFDVSGYCLSNKFSNKSNMIFIYLLKMAKRKKIPLYILPQSFGPFDYKGLIGKYINFELKKHLDNAIEIFVREKDGQRLLSSHYGISNTSYSFDLVLANKEINYESICNKTLKINGLDVSSDRKWIGIIPSNNNYIFSNSEKIDSYYVDVINHILDNGDFVYLAYHAGDDRETCRRIKKYFANEERVYFNESELSFYEFEKVVESFKYMISSRYHSIVLAYKHGTPCLVFAWAVKYHELVEIFSQSQYLLDMGTVSDSQQIIELVNKIKQMYEIESKHIKKTLERVQENSCFNMIFSDKF